MRRWAVALGLVALSTLPIYQSTNLALVSWLGLDARLGVHRVNDLATLSRVGELGLRTLELDLLYLPEAERFEVAHDSASSDNLMLADYAKNIPATVETLWLDVKNVDAQRLGAMMAVLEREIEPSRFNRVMFESSLRSDALAKTTERGFYTSYYLPTDELLALWASGDTAQMDQVADALATQLGAQKVSAISFDRRLYGFVKDYVEPRLERDLDYHVWSEKRLSRWYFLPRLSWRDYFEDARVKTILIELKGARRS